MSACYSFIKSAYTCPLSHACCHFWASRYWTCFGLSYWQIDLNFLTHSDHVSSCRFISMTCQRAPDYALILAPFFCHYYTLLVWFKQIRIALYTGMVCAFNIAIATSSACDFAIILALFCCHYYVSFFFGSNRSVLPYMIRKPAWSMPSILLCQAHLICPWFWLRSAATTTLSLFGLSRSVCLIWLDLEPSHGPCLPYCGVMQFFEKLHDTAKIAWHRNMEGMDHDWVLSLII